MHSSENSLSLFNSKKYFKPVEKVMQSAEISITIMNSIDIPMIMNPALVEEFIMEQHWCKLWDIRLNFVYKPISEYPEATMDFMSASELIGGVITIKIAQSYACEPPTDLDFLGKKITGVIVAATSESFVMGGEDASQSTGQLISLTIKPMIHKMMNRTQKKNIYQGLSTREIILKLFAKNKYLTARMDSTNPDLDIARTYVTQYNETDFEFLCRLLIENNLFFFVYYDKLGIEFFAIGDTPSSLINTTPPKNFLRSADPYIRAGQIVMLTAPRSFSGKSEFPHLRSTAKIKLTDPLAAPFSTFYRSSLVYLAGVGEQFEAPDFDKLGVATMYVVSAKTVCRPANDAETTDAGLVEAARALGVSQRPEGTEQSLLGKYTLTHEITYQSWNPAIDGISLHTPVDKPKIPGSQYARVVGPAPHEPLPETYSGMDGKVAIQYYWGTKNAEGLYMDVEPEEPPLNDPEQTGLILRTIFVNVAQLFGGASGKSGHCGTWFMPRVGQKVVVNFLNGDPDKPVITGTVYGRLGFAPFVYNSPTDVLPIPSTANIYKDPSLEDGFNNTSYFNQEETAGLMGSNQTAIVTCSTPEGVDGHKIILKDQLGEEEFLTYSSGNRTEFIKKNHYTTLEKGNAIHTIKIGDYTLQLADGNINVVCSKDITFTANNIAFNSTGTLNLNSNIVQINGENISVSSSAATNLTAGEKMELTSMMTVVNAGEVLLMNTGPAIPAALQAVSAIVQTSQASVDEFLIQSVSEAALLQLPVPAYGLTANPMAKATAEAQAAVIAAENAELKAAEMAATGASAAATAAKLMTDIAGASAVGLASNAATIAAGAALASAALSAGAGSGGVGKAVAAAALAAEARGVASEGALAATEAASKAEGAVGEAAGAAANASVVAALNAQAEGALAATEAAGAAGEGLEQAKNAQENAAAAALNAEAALQQAKEEAETASQEAAEEAVPDVAPFYISFNAEGILVTNANVTTMTSLEAMSITVGADLSIKSGAAVEVNALANIGMKAAGALEINGAGSVAMGAAGAVAVSAGGTLALNAPFIDIA